MLYGRQAGRHITSVTVIVQIIAWDNQCLISNNKYNENVTEKSYFGKRCTFIYNLYTYIHTYIHNTYIHIYLYIYIQIYIYIYI